MNTNSLHSDFIIIGAGAAGLFAAGKLTQLGKTVRIIDSEDKPGKKILISGGGYCNFTNIHTSPSHFISDNPHFCTSALSRYSPYHFIELVEKYHIPYHEKVLGQMFCDTSARDIVRMLMFEINQNKLILELQCKVESVTKSDIFFVHTNKGIYSSQSVIVSSGGLSIPKMGASCIGYDIALSFGHTIIPTKPGLVPLIVQAETFPYSDLAGLSIQSEIQTEESPIFKEGLLFTHKGLSGPAILQASSYINHTNSVTINTLIDPSNYTKIAQGDFGRMEWKNALSTIFPKRFAYAWAQYHKQSETYSHYSEKTRKLFAEQLMNWQPIIAGNEGYSKAEVTVGGVNTKELSSKTMMSNKIPNLYFIGEVVDVTGHLGGYNFQWAWASAHAISISSN